ncbi:MAG: hypothetical protein JOY54_20665 [Acidobacteriaceae bacterium]|nr:hypothetical protein [Acidobacteriaceae bacterium]
MNNRARWSLGFLSLALAVGVPLRAQSGDQGKAPVYTYLAEWAVPRAQWADMVKLDEQDRALMDKLVADGTLTSYGAFTNLIHQEGEATHGTWFTATSEGNLLKALEAVYAQPGSTTAPVQGASKHWDYVLVSRTYNQRPGKYEGGYLAGDQWFVKPGSMRAYNDLLKAALVPVCEKLLADGVVTAYGVDTEDFHTEKPGRVTFYYTTADASAFDKASKAFDDAFEKNPALVSAFQSMVDREGHRDFLNRLRYMSNK